MHKVILFTHPPFLDSQSMPRFAVMLCRGLKEQGVNVEIWTAKPYLHRLPLPRGFKKWLGYIDQYIIFPLLAKRKIHKCPNDTLFVFADNALGPWVPLVKHRPHVIHCHDFMAQQSALDAIPENPTSFTGKLYQRFIRYGYRRGQYFISVSAKTKLDLEVLLGRMPLLSEVVYNGFNRSFKVVETVTARAALGGILRRDVKNGYILHVGGNQWYKNRLGVVSAYCCWRSLSTANTLPLILLGSTPNGALNDLITQSVYSNDIIVLSQADDALVTNAYSGASFLFFPSLNEGFGWPIIEAMACGCRVLTTNIAPLNEVGSSVAFYVNRMPQTDLEKLSWLADCAKQFNDLIAMDAVTCKELIKAGMEYSLQFDQNLAMNQIITHYQRILAMHTKANNA